MIQNAITAHCCRSVRPIWSMQYAYRFIGSIHLFKITGMLNSEYIKLNKNYIWDTLEIDWKEVSVTFNNSKIKLWRIFMIKLKDEIKIRGMIKREPLLFHVMLKQGITWSTLASSNQESVQDNRDNFPDGLCIHPTMQLPVWIFLVLTARGQHTCGSDS